MHRRRVYYQRNCSGWIANFHCWPGTSRTLKKSVMDNLCFTGAYSSFFLPYLNIFPAVQFLIEQLYNGAQHCNPRRRIDLAFFPALMRGYPCILESKSFWSPVLGRVTTQCLTYWSNQEQLQHIFLGGGGSVFSFTLKALKE